MMVTTAKPSSLSPPSLRDDLLNETLFSSLNHAREVLAEWQDDYSPDRKHGPAAAAGSRSTDVRSCGATKAGVSPSEARFFPVEDRFRILACLRPLHC
jgi:hypothetical protein